MATLQILREKTPIPLNMSQMGIGRAHDNEIVIDDSAVSAYHALITIKQFDDKHEREECILEDLNSTNKTYVNNVPIKSCTLKEGDIVRVGETRLKFSTQHYEPPQTQFAKTQKLDKKVVSSYLHKK